MKITAQDRLMRHVAIDGNDCWLWTAAIDPTGYGRFYLDGKMRYAHRASFALFVGPIPEGREIDHICRVRHCVNPEHLRAITKSANIARRKHAPGAIPTERHGTLTGYTSFRCRCEACSDAHRVYQRGYYARRFAAPRPVETEAAK